MLTLGGYQLLGDNPDLEIESFINKYINPESFMPWLRRAFPGFGLVGLTQPLGYAGEPAFKLNRFHWPSSASRWAYGHFLVDSGTLANLIPLARNAANGSYTIMPFFMGNPESNQGGTIGINPAAGFLGEAIQVGVYMLPPTPLSGIRTMSGNPSLYLITIVDSRYFWWWVPWQSAGNPVVISSSTTWAGLYKIITSILSITLNVDAINPAYLQPSIQMWSLPYEPIPVIFDAIAFNIGHRISANFDGSFNSNLYNTDLTAFNTDMASHPNRVILSGGQRFASPL